MSLVGPRPLPPGDGPPPERAAPAGVRPGITGLWQISGRSELPWEEMAVLDLHYVEQHWLGLDLLILARTLAAAGAPGPPRRRRSGMPERHRSPRCAATVRRNKWVVSARTD